MRKRELYNSFTNLDIPRFLLLKSVNKLYIFESFSFSTIFIQKHFDTIIRVIKYIYTHYVTR